MLHLITPQRRSSPIASCHCRSSSDETLKWTHPCPYPQLPQDLQTFLVHLCTSTFDVPHSVLFRSLSPLGMQPLQMCVALLRSIKNHCTTGRPWSVTLRSLSHFLKLQFLLSGYGFENHILSVSSPLFCHQRPIGLDMQCNVMQHHYQASYLQLEPKHVSAVQAKYCVHTLWFKSPFVLDHGHGQNPPKTATVCGWTFFGCSGNLQHSSQLPSQLHPSVISTFLSAWFTKLFAFIPVAASFFESSSLILLLSGPLNAHSQHWANQNHHGRAPHLWQPPSLALSSKLHRPHHCPWQ